MNGVAPCTVLLVDDHAVVRLGVRTLIEHEAGLRVVGEAATGQDAIQVARRLKPDLVLLDITLPDLSGLEVLARIKQTRPECKVVIQTMHEGEDYFFRALQAGADGYVIKAGGTEHLIAAVRAVMQGGVYLYPSLARTIVRHQLREESGALEKALSPREIEVVRLIAEGLSNKEIAAQLSISVTTAQTHRNHIMEKLRLHTAVELVRYAIRRGIISLD